MALSDPQPIGPDPVSPEDAATAALGSPPPEAVAACRANPEALAALQSGDPTGFARAMGIEHPCEAFLAAANTKGSPFDPQASGPWPDRRNRTRAKDLSRRPCSNRRKGLVAMTLAAASNRILRSL